MKTQSKVGLFLGIGLIVVALSIFSLGSNKSIFQKSITMHAYFDSVQGLNKGGIVTLAGVKVGNIEDVEFDDKKNLVKVSFLINEEYIQKIKIDSLVEIKTQGALGDKYLYITPGTQTEIVKNNTEMKSDYGSDIFSVIGKRGSDTEKIFDTINELHTLVKSLNKDQKIPSLIKKMDNTAGNLQSVSEQIKLATSNQQAQKAMTRINSILDKIETGQGTLGALINDKSIHNRLKSFLGAGEKQKQLKNTLESSVE